MSRYNACEALLDRNLAEGRGEKLAFVDPARGLTYSQLATETRKFANVLKEMGVRREQRVALALVDTVDWPVVFLGAIRAGIVPVCLNTLLTSEQYAYMLADSRATVLLVSPALLPVLRPALAKAPDLAHVVVVGPGAEGGEHDFAALMAKASDAFAPVDTHPDETAFWLYSSGSTGAPKGAKHVHTSLMDTAKLFGQAVLGLREDDVVHSAAKLFFAYGLGNSLSFPMSVGATAILNPDRPTPAVVFDILEKKQATIFCGVPTLFAAMLHDPAYQSAKASPRLRLSTSAGEALP
ncbi:MAG: benzoate-CoA ligase family protein, partial [Rhodoblastus sp.]